MDDARKSLLDALNELEKLYLHSEEIDPALPVAKYLQRTSRTIGQEATTDSPNVSKWFEEVGKVAGGAPTSELQDLFTELQAEQKLLVDSPAIGRTILTLTAVLIECRYEVSETPVEPVTSKLSELPTTDESERWEMLEVASKETIDIARTTAVAKMTLDRLADIEFVHSNESVDDVSDTVRSVHADRNAAALQRLAFAADRSHRGEWTQTDLTGYTDDQTSGEPFEHLIADLWSHRGYETSLTAGGSDGGVDIIATDGNEDLLIQAKRYDGRRVSATEIRELAGLFPQFEFDRALMVTSSDATEPAQEEAARIDKLELITGSELARLLTKSEFHPPVQPDWE